MRNPWIQVEFDNGILIVTFEENAEIDVHDLEEVYAFANEKSAGKAYGVIFEAVGHYKVKEEALPYIAQNPNNRQVLAKAYVINTKEAELKTKYHFVFDKPELKPDVFPTKAEAISWMRAMMDKP